MNAAGDMDFTRDEVERLGLGHLTPEELDQALEAFNGFAALFGKKWVGDYFGSALTPVYVRAIMDLWRDWMLVRDLPKSQALVDRWRHGINEGGVQAEVRLIARLIRAGARAELSPDIGGRVPDGRVRAEAEAEWAYIEISQRGISEIRQRVHQVLQRASDAAADAQPGAHGKVAILRLPDATELDQITAWLSAGPPDGDRLDDLAEFHVAPIDEAVGGEGEILEQLVLRPRLIATSVHMGGGRRGSAVVGVTDAAAGEVLKTEAAQLPRDEAGIVVLDISGVIGGLDEWEPLIRRRLQPTINTRISAVVLVSRVLPTKGPPEVTGKVILNEHARKPLSAEMAGILRRVVRVSGHAERPDRSNVNSQIGAS